MHYIILPSVAYWIDASSSKLYAMVAVISNETFNLFSFSTSTWMQWADFSVSCQCISCTKDRNIAYVTNEVLTAEDQT